MSKPGKDSAGANGKTEERETMDFSNIERLAAVAESALKAGGDLKKLEDRLDQQQRTKKQKTTK